MNSIEILTVEFAVISFLNSFFDPEIQMPVSCVHYGLLESEAKNLKWSLIFDVVDEIFILLPKVV